MLRHTFHPSILRQYDIRGTFGETLDSSDAIAIGRSFGTIISLKYGKTASCAVGIDGRDSSPLLEESLIEGLKSTGVNIIRVGLGPSPMLYFSVFHLDVDAAVMVTGSHNPKDQNGFKFMLGKRSYFGSDIELLGEISASGEFSSGQGFVEEVSVVDSYVGLLANAWSDYNGNITSVAWDPGNGASGEITEILSRKLPGNHELINTKVDGTFPNHHPDPTVEENLIQIREVVERERCDLGFALDGDGDRIGVIDSHGRILWPDQLLSVLAREVLHVHPGSVVIGDVKCSQVLFDEISRLGGVPIMWNTGHSLIKTKMADEGAFLAGEMSGHIFFSDEYFGYDDALYAAVRLLRFLDQRNLQLSEVYDSLPHPVNTPEIRFDCPDEIKFDLVNRVCNRLKSEGVEVLDIDGVRVSKPYGWWLLRASNTQPALVVRVEGENSEALSELWAELTSLLEDFGVKLPA